MSPGIEVPKNAAEKRDKHWRYLPKRLEVLYCVRVIPRYEHENCWKRVADQNGRQERRSKLNLNFSVEWPPVRFRLRDVRIDGVVDWHVDANAGRLEKCEPDSNSERG